MIWEFIPGSWGSQVYGNEIPDAGVPLYTGMQFQIQRYPNIWDFIPAYRGTPLTENAYPGIGVLQYLGMQSHTLENTLVQECMP
jgi:hypothetical protein